MFQIPLNRGILSVTWFSLMYSRFHKRRSHINSELLLLGFVGICHMSWSKSIVFKIPQIPTFRWREKMNLNRIDNMAEIIGGKKTSFKQVHSAFSNVKDDRCCHFESALLPKTGLSGQWWSAPQAKSAWLGTYNVLLGETFLSSIHNFNLKKSEFSL